MFQVLVCITATLCTGNIYHNSHKLFTTFGTPSAGFLDVETISQLLVSISIVINQLVHRSGAEAALGAAQLLDLPVAVHDVVVQS